MFESSRQRLATILVLLALPTLFILVHVLSRSSRTGCHPLPPALRTRHQLWTLSAAIEEWTFRSVARTGVGHEGPDQLEVLLVPDADGYSLFRNHATDQLLLDAWGGRILWEPLQDGHPGRLISFGADGLPGGSGEDADLVEFVPSSETR